MKIAGEWRNNSTPTRKNLSGATARTAIGRTLGEIQSMLTPNKKLVGISNRKWTPKAQVVLLNYKTMKRSGKRTGEKSKIQKIKIYVGLQKTCKNLPLIIPFYFSFLVSSFYEEQNQCQSAQFLIQ